jgi:hypothetical protein
VFISYSPFLINLMFRLLGGDKGISKNPLSLWERARVRVVTA